MLNINEVKVGDRIHLVDFPLTGGTICKIVNNAIHTYIFYDSFNAINKEIPIRESEFCIFIKE